MAYCVLNWHGNTRDRNLCSRVIRKWGLRFPKFLSMSGMGTPSTVPTLPDKTNQPRRRSGYSHDADQKHLARVCLRREQVRFLVSNSPVVVTYIFLKPNAQNHICANEFEHSRTVAGNAAHRLAQLPNDRTQQCAADYNRKGQARPLIKRSKESETQQQYHIDRSPGLQP